MPLDNQTYEVPEINFESGVLTQDLLRGHFAFLQQTLREQMQILGGGSYGIVDSVNPRTAQGDTNLRPFQIQAVDSDSTLYTVSAGICVTGAGDVVALEAPATIRLASQTQGILNLICLRFQIKDSGGRALTSTNHITSTGTVGVTDVLCMTESAYSALTVTERKRVVCLGYVVAAGTAQEIVFTDTDREYVRPWFTTADSDHRSRIGTGTVSDSNPHGTGLADIGIGDHKVLDLLTGSGMVVSPDLSIKGVPGTYCRDVFTATQVRVDADGSVTKNSFFGGASGTFYVVLSAVPNTVAGARDTAGYPVSVDWIKGTSVVVVYAKTKPTQSITISYTKTTSLALSAVSPMTISVSGVDPRDVVISDGLPVPSLLQGSVSLRRFGNIPRTFSVFCTDTGYLVTDPAVVAPALNVNTYIAENLLTGTWTPKRGSRIGIGAHDLGASPSMRVRIQVQGTDILGASVTETLDLTQSMYEDAAYPPSAREYDSQVRYTNTVFLSVDSIMLTPDTVSVSRTGTVTVYGKFDATQHRFAHVCSGFWNGREVLDVRDERRVLTGIRDGWFGETDVTVTAEVLVAANEVASVTALATDSEYKRVGLVFTEDFREPRYLDADTTLWEGSVPPNALIPASVTDSDRYRGVYRSRMLPIRKYDTELCGFIVFLHAEDTASVSVPGAVRVLLRNDGHGANTYGEIVLVQMQGDLSGRVFIGYTNANYHAAGVVVSGRCRAVSVYFSNASNVDAQYVVPVITKTPTA